MKVVYKPFQPMPNPYCMPEFGDKGIQLFKLCLKEREESLCLPARTEREYYSMTNLDISQPTPYHVAPAIGWMLEQSPQQPLLITEAGCYEEPITLQSIEAFEAYQWLKHIEYKGLVPEHTLSTLRFGNVTPQKWIADQLNHTDELLKMESKFNVEFVQNQLKEELLYKSQVSQIPIHLLDMTKGLSERHKETLRAVNPEDLFVYHLPSQPSSPNSNINYEFLYFSATDHMAAAEFAPSMSDFKTRLINQVQNFVNLCEVTQCRYFMLTIPYPERKHWFDAVLSKTRTEVFSYRVDYEQSERKTNRFYATIPFQVCVWELK